VPTAMVEPSGDHLVGSFMKDHVADTLHLAGDGNDHGAVTAFPVPVLGLPDKPIGTRWQG